MTLSTNILFLDPVDRDELYKVANSLVVDASDPETHAHETLKEVHVDRILNHPGQGYAAWLWVVGNEDGTPSMTTNPEHDEDCEEGCDYWAHQENYFSLVNIDTAYGYRGLLGETCAMLHARIILELANWAKSKNVRVRWTNEYSGSTHDADDLDAITQFIGAGDDANEWFASIKNTFFGN